MLIFFVISGYFITESWVRDPSLPRFMVRRALRILPALALAVGFAAFVVGPIVTRMPLSQYFSDPAFFTYLKNVWLQTSFSLPGVFETNRYPASVNGSLWTLPIEALMYGTVVVVLGWSAIRLFGKWAALLVLLGTSAASWYVNAYLPTPPSSLIVAHHDLRRVFVFYLSQDPNATIGLAPYFWAGACASLFGLARYINVQTALAILLISLCFSTRDLTLRVGSLIMIPAVTYITLALGFAESSIMTRFVRRGDLSYGAYLYGFIIQQVLSHFFPHTNPYENFLMAIPLVFGCAWVSWHLVEKPCLRFKPGSARKTEDAPAVGVAVSARPS